MRACAHGVRTWRVHHHTCVTTVAVRGTRGTANEWRARGVMLNPHARWDAWGVVECMGQHRVNHDVRAIIPVATPHILVIRPNMTAGASSTLHR